MEIKQNLMKCTHWYLAAKKEKHVCDQLVLEQKPPMLQ
jgi:hypothetical protein